MANNAIGVFILGGCLAAVLVGCSNGEPTRDTTPVITPKTMADALYVVMESNRTIYTRTVVNRLHNEEHLIKTSEHWKDDKALPLPSQMFRMGAEMAAEKTDVFRYALLSLWPINKQNGPKTEVETHGLTAVAENPGPYYAEEELGGKKFFTAISPDVAVAPACVACHNNHKDSPRNDFKLADTRWEASPSVCPCSTVAMRTRCP